MRDSKTSALLQRSARISLRVQMHNNRIGQMDFLITLPCQEKSNPLTETNRIYQRLRM
jgi:hypothetical protein